MGVRSPKPFIENNHSAIFTVLPFFLGLCPKIGVAVGGWGPESQINTWNLVRKISHFFKKTKFSKQPKKQNKPNFTSHLVESQTYAVGGWGPMFGTKSQKPSLIELRFHQSNYFGNCQTLASTIWSFSLTMSSSIKLISKAQM